MDWGDSVVKIVRTMTLVLVFLDSYLQIVYITHQEINKIFTSPVLFFYHMANILRTDASLLSLLIRTGRWC
jgi:hypothetical protein